MTKAPRAGQVKTRLSPLLTPEEAAALSICFLRDTTTAIALTLTKEIARGIAVYTPVGAQADYIEVLPAEFQLLPQRGEALGERMIFAIEDLFRLGFASVCLIASDSPTVPPRVFTEAATVLARPEQTVVMGPTKDGGYYLIGMQQQQRALFEDIDWSTEKVLEQTSERARQMNLRVHLLPTWYDVDDRMTLRLLCDDLFGPKRRETLGYPAPSTRVYLSQLLEREGRDRIWPKETPP